jgi:hypothetical protein
MASFSSAIKAEVDRSRLQHFAYVVDQIYKNKFYEHYTSFNNLDHLLDPEISDKLYTEIERGFPMHFMVIKSLIFGSEAHYASRQNQKRHDYSDKQRSLLNYFFALIRVRDPSCLVTWAIVGTMAMLTTGAKVKHFKNNLVKSFSVGEAVSDAHLDQLFQETKSARLKLLTQAIGHHSFDNYNRDHPIAVRDDHGSIYHVGLVYNCTRARAFCVPVGSTVKEKLSGRLWTVESSSLTDYWTCKSDIFAIAESGETVHKVINLPSIEWNIKTVPGSPGPVKFTYNNQYIPYSMRQKVPTDITHQQLLFGDRKWMKDPEYKGQMRPFNPREHKNVMCAVYRLRQFYMYNRWCAGENIGESPLDQRVIDSFSIIDSIAKKKPELKTYVTSYQEDSLQPALLE